MSYSRKISSSGEILLYFIMKTNSYKNASEKLLTNNEHYFIVGPCKYKVNSYRSLDDNLFKIFDSN